MNGFYWNARYNNTVICKIGNIAVAISIVILQIFHIVETIRLFPFSTYNIFYLAPLVYFLVMLYFGLKKTPEEFLKEPQKGRYAVYRIDPKYINGLSEKNRKRHLEKYEKIINDRRISLTT